MNKLASSAFALLFASTFALAACGDASDSAETSSAAAAGSGGATTSSGAGAGGATSSSGAGGEATEGLKEIGTYVVLGDSISDKGGSGPYFYDLLAANDDALYPEWQGSDLKSRYGEGLAVVSNSKAGAVSKDLPGQVSSLPATLTGPVVVTITIGGNDMQANILPILQGDDASARDKFRGNLSAALTELTSPGRFGEGVEVIVFEADIYDPTDGAGDFKDQGCPVPLSLLPTTPTDGFFTNWNGVVAEEVPTHEGAFVTGLHDWFYGHGLEQGADTWFAGDCIHPNRMGHAELRAMFWKAITGESAP